ncbi:MAG: AMIN domain-containing protein [Terriglobales bacterium]
MFGALGVPRLLAQTGSHPGTSPSSYAVVKSIRMVREKDGPAVEILSTKPLIPAVQALNDPLRLVIDLPNARLEVRQKRISIQADQISTLRADQFQENPPVARVVLDLLAPRSSTWEAAGNRLVVHLGKNPQVATDKSPFQAPSVASLTPAPQPVAAVLHAAGPMVLIGNGTVSGSSITASDDTAILSLTRGGEVHVCPRTTVSVTPSQSGHNLMFGVNTGAIEMHYRLDASSDSLITPDFRILFAGPGEFHYAISADNRGNTCVRALPGNTASAIVSELIGDRTYQVKATDQLLFHGGSLDRVDMAVPLECGCPPPRQPVLRVADNPPVVAEAQPSANANPTAKPVSPEIIPPSNAAQGLPDAAAVPGASATSNELHVQVDAPFVFHATGPPPAPVEDVRALPLDSRPLTVPALSAPLPPPASARQKPAGTGTTVAGRAQHRGFFRKLGGFLAAMFR